ncbi:hypothetical protein EYF80_023736 [Liparis tanakae]|uniref:Uncharacterized protein n=1 Tax=Liparis tanakae TaxID=230148 RepID=A0A4Z2HK55_9TELE|nr:hypothetical protein EYF80_023736 [Liparis tanakae]
MWAEEGQQKCMMGLIMAHIWELVGRSRLEDARSEAVRLEKKRSGCQVFVEKIVGRSTKRRNEATAAGRCATGAERSVFRAEPGDAPTVLRPASAARCHVFLRPHTDRTDGRLFFFFFFFFIG